MNLDELELIEKRLAARVDEMLAPLEARLDELEDAGLAVTVMSLKPGDVLVVDIGALADAPLDGVDPVDTATEAISQAILAAGVEHVGVLFVSGGIELTLLELGTNVDDRERA